MLSLSDPRTPLPSDLLDQPGAFLWWYVDVRGEGGDGLVLIWSFGLPFLPDLSGAPRSRPSINLATYRRGRPDLYLLQEQDPDRVSWDPQGRWAFEDSRLWWERDEHRLRLHAELDLEVPGSDDRLAARIELEGARARLEGTPEPGEHAWAPLTGVSTAQATLRHGSWSQTLQGSGYHDRNACTRPYAELGVRDWVWGRAALGDRQLIWYLVEGEGREDRVVMVEADGRVRDLGRPRVKLPGTRRDLYGLRWAPRIELELDGEHIEIVQDPPAEHGPFYLRHPVSASGSLGAGTGWGELVSVDQLHRPWQAPFVRMRVHRRREDSFWLPLFTGPRAGRLSRLLR